MDERTLDRDAERLFALKRTASFDDPGLIALTRFVDDLRDAYATAPDPATRAAHIQAAVEAFRDAGVFSNGHHSNGTKVRGRRSRRFVVRGGIAAGAIVLAGGSAMAATGALPDAAQDAVSKVANTIGISIPKGDPKDATDEIDADVDRNVRVTRVNSRPKDDAKDAKPKATGVVDDDPDDSDGSGGGGALSTGNRRPSNDRPSRPSEPDRPDPDDDGSASGDPSGGGDRGDPSGGSDPDDDAPDKPSDPDDPSDDGDGGGRGDPLDGSSGGDEEDGSSADDAGASDSSDADDADDGGRQRP